MIKIKRILTIGLLTGIFLLSSCARTPSVAVSSVSAPHTTNKTALRIYDRLPIYAAAAKMPWPPIPASNKSAIRERLIALHYLPQNHPALSLSSAIAEFQYNNGLKQTGIMNAQTIHALNITPAERYQELVTSMQEWAKYPEEENSRYLQINIPSYTLQLISHGNAVLEMKVIVGRPSRPTPLLSSQITTLVFNPSWNVPETILSQDVIPGMRENPHYLKEHYDMRVYANFDKQAPEIDPSTIDWQTATAKNFSYRVTAPPSDVNPLGRVKFIFNNDHDVYLHDTPEKSLFSLTDRARSSGCIRLENAMALVEYFYVDNTDLNAGLVDQYLSSHETKYIQLRHPLPVYITYITAWVDRYGRVHFAPDIYDRSA